MRHLTNKFCAATVATMSLAGCSTTGPTPVVSNDTPYQTLATPGVVVQERLGSDVMRWGMNNGGYFTPKGTFAVASSVEGCWNTYKARVSIAAEKRMVETTVVNGQWLGVPEWKCKASGAVFGSLTDTMDSIVATSEGNGTRMINYRHEYFDYGNHRIRVQNFPPIEVWKDSVDTRTNFRRCFYQVAAAGSVGGSATFLNSAYPVLPEMGQVIEGECPKFEITGAAWPANTADGLRPAF